MASLTVIQENVQTLDNVKDEATELGAKAQAKKPKMYRVILLNDDYTPMEFVVDVLQRFFFMSYEQAKQVMLQVHEKGRGCCGVFSRDIAETKVRQVNDFSRLHEHPLACGMEPE